MAVGLCIPKSITDKVRSAIKSGDINLDKFYGMDSEARHEVLSHYVGTESAHLVNEAYEKARLVAERKATADYVSASDKSTFAAKASQGEFAKNLLTDKETQKMNVARIDKQIADVQARQKSVSDGAKGLTGEDKANAQIKLGKLKDQEARLTVRRENTLNPSADRFLNKLEASKKILGDDDYKELVKAKLGQDVSPAEGKYILDKTNQLRELSKDNPDSTFGATPEYIKARNELDSYIHDLEPTSPLSILKNGIEIARNFLITGISTPLKVLTNYINHPTGELIRRLSARSLNGENADLARDLKKQDVDFTKKTGTSAAQMTDINDSSTVLGSRPKGSVFKNETFNDAKVGAVKGAIGVVEKVVAKTAQASHYVAITLEHALAYNYVFRSTFYDVLNLRASDYAKTEGLKGDIAKNRAREIMTDAARVDPKTAAGKSLRNAAQAVAARITNTNDTYASRAAVGIKNGLNQIGGPNAPVGDLLEPMAKIPANVIANAIEDTPAGLPKGLYDIVKGRLNMRAEKSLETRYEGLMQYSNGIESAIRIGGALAVAGIITSQLTDKDFKSDQYGDHFVKIGDLWVNTEYISRLAPDIAGIMAVKMNPKQNPLKEFLTGNSVGQGSLGDLENIPGIDGISQSVQSALGKNPVGSFEGFLGSRVPSILGDFGKTRTLDRIFFGANGVETTEQVAQDAKDSAKKAAATRKANAANK